MSKKRKITLGIVIGVVVLLSLFYTALTSTRPNPDPEDIIYGVSFNTKYAEELGLDWKEAYEAALTDLDVKHFRLAAHWNLVEPRKDEWNFEELDYQVRRAQEEGADVIFSVGRRLPRWPECHVPDWAKDMKWEDQKQELREYFDVVINRYKEYDNIILWQVENEAFVSVYAHHFCGSLDVDFLDEEIARVRSLDPDRKIIMTDSSDLGTWFRPFKRGDAFGTTFYLYVWNDLLGQVKTLFPPSWYRAKAAFMEWLYGKKEVILIELSVEPWLDQPIIQTPHHVQMERMNLERFDEIISYASKTGMDKQYLWGVEWWYYLKKNYDSGFWDRAQELFEK